MYYRNDSEDPKENLNEDLLNEDLENQLNENRHKHYCKECSDETPLPHHMDYCPWSYCCPIMYGSQMMPNQMMPNQVMPMQMMPNQTPTMNPVNVKHDDDLMYRRHHHHHGYPYYPYYFHPYFPSPYLYYRPWWL